MKAGPGLYWAMFVADHHDVGDGWWIVMMIGMVLVWLLVAVAVVLAVRYFARQPPTASRAEDDGTALQILARRLADGSISLEEYEQRRRVLLESRSEGSEA